MSRTQASAKSRGEYHKKPTTMVDIAATRIASQFKLCMCMKIFSCQQSGKLWAPSYDALGSDAKENRQRKSFKACRANGSASRRRPNAKAIRPPEVAGLHRDPSARTKRPPHPSRCERRAPIWG